MVFEYTDKGHKTLSIGFAGFYDENPRFDWNVLKRFDTDILLIKDDKMAWYLLGLGGISNDVMGTVKFIHKYTYKYDKLIFFGSSMGGYASLLYGCLVYHENKVINAFGPQVNISPEAPNMNQWTVKAVKEKVYPFIGEHDKKYLSLYNSGISVPKDTYIHYGGGHRCDTYHAGLIDCNKKVYDCDNHSIARWMHENSMLKPYLEDLYK